MHGSETHRSLSYVRLQVEVWARDKESIIPNLKQDLSCYGKRENWGFGHPLGRKSEIPSAIIVGYNIISRSITMHAGGGESEIIISDYM